MQKWLRVHYSTVPGRVWTDQFRRMSERLQIVFARAVPTSSAVARYHSIATHPRINDPPSTTDQAVDQFEAWMESPTLEVLSESSVHRQTLKEALAEGRIAGPLVQGGPDPGAVPDTASANLWSAVREFSRFSDVRVINPLSLTDKSD